MVFLQAVVAIVCRGTLDDLQALRDLLKEIDWFCQNAHVQANRRPEQDRRREKAKVIYRNILMGEAGEIKVDLTPEDGAVATMEIAGSRSGTYTLVATEAGVTCTCPDSWDHGRLCKHKMAFSGVLRAHLPHLAAHLATQFVEPPAKVKPKSAAA